jgi:hypothetical protein
MEERLNLLYMCVCVCARACVNVRAVRSVLSWPNVLSCVWCLESKQQFAFHDRLTLGSYTNRERDEDFQP